MCIPIFDSHCDTILRVVDEQIDLSIEQNQGHIDLPRLKEAGFKCQVFACYTSVDSLGDRTVERSSTLLEAVLNLENIDGFVIPKTRNEFLGLKDSDNVGIIPAIEGGEALGGNPEAVEDLSEKGVKYITIAWGDNDLVGGSYGEAYGLTDTGRAVISEMEKHNILPDMSHTSDKGFADVVEETDGIIIASHSNARAICPSPRNLTDEQIRIIADRGGAIGVVYSAGFLTREADELQSPIFRKYLELAKAKDGSIDDFWDKIKAEISAHTPPSYETIADHIDYIHNVGGMDVLALGSDFDGYLFGPEGINDCRDVRKLEPLLSRRGYSEDQIEKIFWSNWERVFASTFQ